MEITKILILCTGNSCRSQMMEGFMRAFAAGKAEVFSAGVEAHGLNPRAVMVMSEAGIDISGQKSELVSDYLGRGITHVITVCDSAAKLCPNFPEQTKVIHHSFSDPAKASGNAQEVLDLFRKVRDEIRDYSKDWIEKL